MKLIEKIHHWLRNLGAYASGITVFVMMFLITADVFMRNVFDSPISGSYEVTKFFLMPLAVFPALAYTYYTGVLPKISLVVDKSPPCIKKIAVISSFVIELLTNFLIAYYGWQLFIIGMSEHQGQSMAGNVVSIYPIYIIIPFGFGLVLIEVILSNIKAVVSNKEQQNKIKEELVS